MTRQEKKLRARDLRAGRWGRRALLLEVRLGVTNHPLALDAWHSFRQALAGAND